MKNLPDKFPIRYALIIPMSEDDFEDEKSYQSEVLFNEYLLMLKDNPLNYSLLFPKYKSVNFTILGKPAFQISKLYAEEGWIDVIKEKMKETMPEAFCSGWSNGFVFATGLYSYKKSCEIPAFSKLRDEKNIDTSYYNKIYERIKKGEIDNWELHSLLGNHERPIEQDLYYSNVWKELDINEEIGGYILRMTISRKDEWFKNLPKDAKNITKIPVLICKSWEDLFAEELFLSYKMFRYCNNCGKALPFGYNGKYCPNEPENIDCIRERARKRKHSQNAN